MAKEKKKEEKEKKQTTAIIKTETETPPELPPQDATALVPVLPGHPSQTQWLPQRMVNVLAEEIAKTMVKRLPSLLPAAPRRRPKKKKPSHIEYALFLDTSAIIDGRIFDLIKLGLLNGVYVVTDSILRELKYIADSQDAVRRERGRRGLERLEKLRKERGIKMVILKEEHEANTSKPGEVDERLITAAKAHKGKIITCDYNLDKRSNIDGVIAINVNAVANALKVTAVPGEAVHIKVQHTGKDATQGVGYLDDGTMIVVEEGVNAVGHAIDVVVSRVIQTATGRILFAKKI
jgi:uncharacterized protein YacL